MKKNNNFVLPGGFIKYDEKYIEYLLGNIDLFKAMISNEFYIKEVVYNNPATIVFWSDNTKTISKCLPQDTYSKEMGLLTCVMKKLTSNHQVSELLSYWIDENKTRVTLKDVREKEKKGNN